MTPSAPTAHDAVIALLESRGVAFRRFEHEPVRTSEEAAQVRGTPLEQGAKALVLETDRGLIVAVLSAARRVDYRALKRHLGSKRVQMAPAEAVREATGCEPGGVPPFGSIFGLPTLVDPCLLELQHMDFNAGDRARSVEMRTADYLAVSGAEVVSFAAPEGPTTT
jgi:Ala-tRNA(Pro) deacylase